MRLIHTMVQALLDTHDTIAERRHTGDATTNGVNGCHNNATFMPEENGHPVDTIRMVGLRKRPDEPLGLTVREDESGYLIIARIMAGGSIDRQGLLHVGDAICEVNGVEVSLTMTVTSLLISKNSFNVSVFLMATTHQGSEVILCYSFIYLSLFSFSRRLNPFIPCMRRWPSVETP